MTDKKYRPQDGEPEVLGLFPEELAFFFKRVIRANEMTEAGQLTPDGSFTASPGDFYMRGLAADLADSDNVRKMPD